MGCMALVFLIWPQTASLLVLPLAIAKGSGIISKPHLHAFRHEQWNRKQLSSINDNSIDSASFKPMGQRRRAFPRVLSDFGVGAKMSS